MSNTITATQRASRVSNQDMPCDFLAMPIAVVLVAGTSTDLDLTIPIQNGIIDSVQTLFVDNSLSAGSLWITASLTRQIIKLPPFTQAYVPILAPTPPVLNFAANGGAVNAAVQLLNFPMPLSIWSSLAATATTNGIVPVSRSLVTAAGASTPLMATNGNRQYLLIKAPELADLWINPIGGAAAVNGLDCIKIIAANIYESGPKVWTTAITYFCVTGALNLTAFEG